MRYSHLYQNLVNILEPRHLEVVLTHELSHRDLVKIVNRSNISFNGVRTATVPTRELVQALGRDFFQDADTAWPLIKALIKRNQALIEDVETQSPDELELTAEQVADLHASGDLGRFLWALSVDRREAVQEQARRICTILDELLGRAGGAETDESAGETAATPSPGEQPHEQDEAHVPEQDKEPEETVVLSVTNLARWEEAESSGREEEPTDQAPPRDLRALLTQRDSEIHRLEAELRSAHRRLKRAQEQLAVLETMCGDLRRERIRLEDQAQELREDLRRAETELGMLRSGSQDSAAVAALRAENERLREHLIEWERRLRFVEDLEADKRRLQAENEALKHRIVTMVRRSLRGERELAQILAAARASVDEMLLYYQEERSLQVDDWARATENKAPRLGVFVDVQNMFYAARSQFHGRLDYEHLLEEVVGDRHLAIAVAYTIQTPDVDQSSFTAFLEHCGYTVKSKALRTRLDGSAKGDWDMEMALDIIGYIGQLDVVCLVSGDGDFVPLVKLLQRHGLEVEIRAFRYNTAVDLREAADRYYAIGEDLIIDQTSKH